MSIDYSKIAKRVREIPKVQYYYATKRWALAHRDHSDVEVITPHPLQTLGVPDDDWAPAQDTDVVIVKVTHSHGVDCYGNLTTVFE